MPPPTVVVPPWLQADPNAAVDRMLSGYRTGVSAGEAQSAAAARFQQQALAQQQAAELNAYRQAQMQQEAAQFNAKLRMDQQKAERDAGLAAIQMEGMKEAESLRAQGMEWPQILARVGTKLFAGDPRGLALGMQGLQKIGPPLPPIFGKTPGGRSYSQNPQTGALQYEPAGSPLQTGPVVAEDLVTAEGIPIGPKVYRSGKVIKPVPSTGLTPQGKISALRVLLFSIEKEMLESSQAAKKLKPKRDALRKQLEDLIQSSVTLPMQSASGSDLDEEEPVPEPAEE